MDTFLHNAAYPDKHENLLEFNSVLLFCQDSKIMKHNFWGRELKVLGCLLIFVQGNAGTFRRPTLKYATLEWKSRKKKHWFFLHKLQLNITFSWHFRLFLLPSWIEISEKTGPKEGTIFRRFSRCFKTLETIQFWFDLGCKLVHLFFFWIIQLVPEPNVHLCHCEQVPPQLEVKLLERFPQIWVTEGKSCYFCPFLRFITKKKNVIKALFCHNFKEGHNIYGSWQKWII